MAENNKLEHKKKEILFDEEEDEEEEDYLEEDNYIKIDSKNSFSVGDAADSKNKLNQILEDNKDFIKENYDSQKKLISLFYEKIYKTNSDPFDICHTLSKQLKKALNKINIDEKLEYFINKKKDCIYHKKLVYDKETIVNLGYIICSSYNKFSSYKINNEKDLKTNIDKTKKDHVDIKSLFMLDCYEHSKKENECSKITYCKKNKNKFFLPGEFIFLMNSLIYIDVIEINFNLEEEKFTKDEVNLFVLSILNIQYLFPNKLNLKINLINEQLQCSLYRRFYKELYNNTKFGNFKMIYMNKDDLYKEKWDFETEFLLEKHRKNKKNNNIEIFGNESFTEENISVNLNTTTNTNDNSNIYEIIDKDKLLKSTNNTYKIPFDENRPSKKSFIYKSTKNADSIYLIKENENNLNSNIENSDKEKNSFLSKSLISRKTQISNNSNLVNKMMNNPNENIETLHYYDIIENFKNSLGLILLLIDSLNYFTNMKRLDLIINDCYQSEFQNFLGNYCSNEMSKKFHIIDILICKLKTLEELNIETNILDHLTFNKILSFINNNLSMTSLKISFFSSDATYLNQTIYKIYYQNIYTNGTTSILKIIDMLLPYFIDSLEVLFELIKKKDFKKIAINFDTPDIIEINNSYMNTIFKFLMNLLFLVDNPQSRIQKLIILSHSTKFDSRYLPSIENILEDINFNENNKFLTELSIHLRFFMIRNIKNLITERLVLLNIGDCDITTFKELTKFLTSYKFIKKSSLKLLGISLLDSIKKYSKEIKNILYKIFSIKIKQLIEINIYTNIYIDNNDENINKDLLDIFSYNYISKCRLTIEPNSKINNIFLKERNINYLVSHCLEETLLSKDELIKRNKIFFDKNKKNVNEINKNDNIYWIIWIFFNKNYYNRGLNTTTIKKFIFNILKYLYFTKNVEIKFGLED